MQQKVRNNATASLVSMITVGKVLERLALWFVYYRECKAIPITSVDYLANNRDFELLKTLEIWPISTETVLIGFDWTRNA